MHAVVFNVDMKQDWDGDRDAELDTVVGMTQGSPGFVKGSWLSDGQRGISVQLYESEEAARAVADGAAMSPDASVSLRSVEVYEVMREV